MPADIAPLRTVGLIPFGWSQFFFFFGRFHTSKLLIFRSCHQLYFNSCMMITCICYLSRRLVNHKIVEAFEATDISTNGTFVRWQKLATTRTGSMCWEFTTELAVFYYWINIDVSILIGCNLKVTKLTGVTKVNLLSSQSSPSVWGFITDCKDLTSNNRCWSIWLGFLSSWS